MSFKMTPLMQYDTIIQRIWTAKLYRYYVMRVIYIFMRATNDRLTAKTASPSLPIPCTGYGIIIERHSNPH